MISKQSKRALSKGCGFGLIFVIIILMAYYSALPERTFEQKSEDYKQELRNGARTATHLLIEQYLQSPDKLRHPKAGDPDETISLSMSNLYVVSSWVDIENPSGKLLRKHYTAKVKYLPPKEKWELLNIEIR